MSKENTEELVVVFGGTPWEAELVKGLLESTGIDAMIKDENFSSIAPSLTVNIGMGEALVLVEEVDASLARKIIADRGHKE